MPQPAPSELLYLALAAPVGIKISTNNRNALEQRLRKAAHQDPDCQVLTFKSPPEGMGDPSTQLWIIKKAAKE